MNVSRRRPHVLGHATQKRDDVVARLGVELFDALQIEARLLANHRHLVGRHQPLIGPCLAHGKLGLEPAFESRLVRPQTPHFFPGIAFDHVDSPPRAPRASDTDRRTGRVRRRDEEFGDRPSSAQSGERAAPGQLVGVVLLR